MYDVSQLVEDTEQRLALQNRVENLQMELSRVICNNFIFKKFSYTERLRCTFYCDNFCIFFFY